MNNDKKGDDALFLADLESLLGLVKYILFEQKLQSINPTEIVTEAYVLCHGQPYSKPEFIKKCRHLIKEHLREIRYRDKDPFDSTQTEKQCTSCKQVLPIQCYGVTVVKRFNGAYINSHCRSCAATRTKSWYLKTKSNPEEWAKYLERQRQWKKLHRKSRAKPKIQK